MSRLLAAIVMFIWAGSAVGCAMCNKCGDDHYTFFGGTHPRANISQGRVGSAFDDAEGVTQVADEEQVLDGEFIDDSAEMPAEEILPVPLEDDAAEPTPAEAMSEPDASPDLPPGSTSTRDVSAPKARTRGKLNPGNYLP